MRDEKRRRRSAIARGVVGVIAVLVVWYLAALFLQGGGGGRLPTPVTVAQQLIALVTDDQFWEALAITLGRSFVGLGIALVASIVLAFLLARSRVMNAALEPLISVLYPVPRIALFPLAVIALGVGTVSQATLVALECLFPLTVTIYAGLRSIDRSVVWLAQNNDVGAIRTWALMLRMALPSVFTGLRIAVPLMLTVMVAAQMFAGSSDGLGYLIQLSAARIQTATIIAVAIMIGAFGYLLDLVVRSLEQVTSRHVTRVEV